MTDSSVLHEDVRSDADINQASDDIIDRVTLSGQMCGDKELERDVLEFFLGQSLIWTRVIRETDDIGTRRRAAHTLKGSALSIGAYRLAVRAGRIEDLDEDCKPGELVAALSALHASVAEARAAIAAMLGSGCAAA